jgi:hypothetical protein
MVMSELAAWAWTHNCSWHPLPPSPQCFMYSEWSECHSYVRWRGGPTKGIMTSRTKVRASIHAPWTLTFDIPTENKQGNKSIYSTMGREMRLWAMGMGTHPTHPNETIPRKQWSARPLVLQMSWKERNTQKKSLAIHFHGYRTESDSRALNCVDFNIHYTLYIY